ncbi:hypothetical protein GCM10011505_24900 [Tistrella bauzanensis]|uniref:Uncharacterized protein n=1 Tax=Tistrella bauzanensis TaxID=657419 RepID=A0ABQ1IKD9_9PROT|nr:hypothetical protein [Tistrella bauzanensis]GGB42538.1 hypothetical protein GCM10011505_24900 [Tistrella bauzanensis]
MTATDALVYHPGTPLAATDRRIWHKPALDSLAVDDTALDVDGIDDSGGFS